MTDTSLQPALGQDKGLKSGALSLVGSVVVGIASTAPAYSLAATLGFVVVTGAGFKAPAIMLLAFVPMYFIAVAYKELNEAVPDCGTTFTWASRAFGPVVGWMGGWGIIVADIIVMANLASIAGSYSFTLADEFGLQNDLASSTLWSTVAGLIWIGLMTYICYRGIEVSARLQYALLSIEVVTLVLFAGVALWKVYAGRAPQGSVHPSLSWLWPGGLSMSVLSSTVLLAVFIYWGWDTAVATNEESDDPGRTPGRAAVISTVLLLLIYVLVSVATVAFAGTGTAGVGLGNEQNAADVFSAIGPTLYGSSTLGHIGLALLAISILTSASASTQTTILPTARTALSMAVFKAIPGRFATIHPRYLTPTWSTIGMGVISAAFYLLMTWISPTILLALIGAIGLQIAFYYGLTGVACAWFYRHSLLGSIRHLFVRGVIPLVGGVFLFVMFGYAFVTYIAPDYLQDEQGRNVTIFGMGAVAVVGVVSLLFGLVLMAAQWLAAPGFFRGRTLPRASHADLVLLDHQRDVAGQVRLPDSTEYTVIAPDLSNLPDGATAVDRSTGRTARPTTHDDA
ncbi:APC family permease [Calidifontibacter sp. DB0510]|uniref:APC family permease n=1 Tax=Metallococcus carri TaxID=1656884 RepID=A0A967AXM4_9MICO|nr:APC family permease [Metallococcus carri]NHN54309.1 APC family permease [Metallococcus carri]NOP36851.1 APC family permease [Calidifontibacter sp. DB2511S]